MFRRARRKIRSAADTLEVLVGMTGAFYEGWKDGAEPETAIGTFLAGRDGGRNGRRATQLHTQAERASFVLTKRFYEGRAAYCYGRHSEVCRSKVVH